MNRSVFRVCLPAVFVLAVIASGCTRHTAKAPDAHPLYLLPFEIVTSSDSRADVKAATTFSWAPDGRKFHDDPRFKDAPVRHIMTEVIASAMRRKGYRFVDTPEASDLLVGYAVALDDTVNDASLDDRYGVRPGPAAESPDPAHYAKGTLIIDVVDRPTGVTALRSAVQGFAGFDITDPARRERLAEIVRRMLATFPTRSGVYP